MNDERDQGAASASQSAEAGTAEAAPPRLRLRSLKVHAFRDVRPGTELTFADGFHLILGKNGSGKSTLLHLLGAASTLDFRHPFFAETPFHLEVSLEVGEIALHAEIKRTFELQRVNTTGDRFLDFPPRDEAEVTVKIEHAGQQLRQRVLLRTGKDIGISNADPQGTEEVKVRSLRVPGVVDPLSLSTGWILGMGATVELDGKYSVSPVAWPAFLHMSARPGTGTPFDEERGALQQMAGGGLLVVRGQGFRSTSPWLPPSLDFNAQGEPVERDLTEDPLLKGAIECLGYDGAKVYFGPGASVNAGWSYASPSFQFFRGGKAVRRHDQLSFGQQRLFSFAWYLACNPDVAIADELVNGLHSEWIDWCVEAIGDRQCFLTSQNPLLVDAVPLASEEDIRRGIILCEAVPATGHLSWRQLEPRESELIARALGQSRLDLLSDLLHALDLW